MPGGASRWGCGGRAREPGPRLVSDLPSRRPGASCSAARPGPTSPHLRVWVVGLSAADTKPHSSQVTRRPGPPARVGPENLHFEGVPR